MTQSLQPPPKLNGQCPLHLLPKLNGPRPLHSIHKQPQKCSIKWAQWLHSVTSLAQKDSF